jgi:hypothetical protein
MLLAFIFDSSWSLCPGGCQLSTFYPKMEDSFGPSEVSESWQSEFVACCYAKRYS